MSVENTNLKNMEHYSPLQKRSAQRYAFVIPRYFAGMAGGAETLVSSLARRLSARGDHVTLLATCARDNRSWENHFPAGETQEEGLRVIRFPVNKRDLDRWIPLQIKISEGMQLTIEDELEWMTHSVNSDPLYSYIVEHSSEYKALFFGPYLFGTTLWGSLIDPKRSFLIPCLHDENYAYTQVLGSMFRQVAGCLFNALPEMELAQALYGRVPGGEVGMGFECPEYRQRAPYFEEEFPYLVYLGRKETGKNVQILIDHFIEAKNSRPALKDLRLVIVGGGSFSDLHRPEALKRDDIIDLSEISEDQKKSLLQHALLLCQPSTNESFSIVLMESWMVKRPVLVHARCAVTRAHVIDSGAGLFFADAREFAACVEHCLTSPELCEQMGEYGLRYVQTRYSWEAVLNRFDQVMQSL